MTPWFNIKKAAQVVAFFANAQGGSINVLKLTKLVYLADRRFMASHGAPILNDRLVSMDHGPVNSITYECVNGAQSDNPAWSDFIDDRAGYQIGALIEVREKDLDELSRAEFAALQQTWAEFGHMDRYEIRDYTHQNCPEWEDPEGSSTPIPYERVFKFLGKSEALKLRDRVHVDREIDEFFAAL